jgi:hypothetical protein
VNSISTNKAGYGRVSHCTEGINRRITIQVGLGKNAKPYWKNKAKGIGGSDSSGKAPA